MSRIQLALNVSDLKRVLLENKETPGGINHLGVEVESSEVLVAETKRFVEAGLTTSIGDGVESAGSSSACC